MLTGLVSLIYLPSTVVFLLVCAGILLFRPFIIREGFILILGAITPVYLLLAFLFFNDRLSSFVIPSLHVGKLTFAFSVLQWLMLGITGVILLTALFYYQQQVGKLLVHAKKGWFLILLLMPVAYLMLLLDTSRDLAVCLLAALPIGWLASQAFFHPKMTWIPTWLHWALFASIIYSQFS
jgi:hypothetical protein